ncbi:long-chain fatty acid--CoA ligase [Micrococcus sp. HSID17228]|nr:MULTISPECIES: AMP-binding protein [unclassified Micrococcus]RUQ40554.1 long-chain fatty acid--CoA ligase [Micrococcus sp. HSID17227]RUQ45266.1 long-chain fatty acid--CoA ligase [Micrococcus sp. HSID17228]
MAELLSATVARQPDAVALRIGEARMTYRELDQVTAATAGWLRHRGVGPGDRVAVMLPNVPAFVAVYEALMRLGAVMVPLNPLFTARELEYFLEDSGARMLWAMPGLPAVDEVAGNVDVEVVTLDLEAVGRECAAEGIAPVTEITPRDPDDDAVLLYTSGTTGRPKGARLTHTNLRSNAMATATGLGRLGPDDVVFAALPMFHVFGLSVVLNGAVFAGSTLSLMPRFVPADFSRLRMPLSGGASLPVETLRAAEKLYGVPVLEGYGLSENAGACFFNPVDAPTRPGTVGRPVDGFEFRIVAMDGTEVPEEDLETSGELRIRGEGIMAGYWGRPEDTEAAFDEDGWFRTGDIARRDEAGYVMIVDRLKDVIIRGGMNVYPREVEEVLYEHPDVVEAAVVGVPDERLGEEIAAFVSLAPGSAVTGEELQAFAAERLARYKRPREVTVLDGLPKNATGKILRRELRQG